MSTCSRCSKVDNSTRSSHNLRFFRRSILAVQDNRGWGRRFRYNFFVRICSYPRDEDELKLLYVFSQELLLSSEIDPYSIELLFKLKKYFSDVLEFSEHLQFVIPQVALINTSGFIMTLSTCEIDEQERIIDLLQFFDNKSAIDTFKTLCPK